MEAIYVIRWTTLVVSEFSPDETGVNSGIEAVCATKERAYEVANSLFEDFIQEALYGLEGAEETEMRNYINEHSVATLEHKELNYLTGSDRVNINIDITCEPVI
jgi:hypothetical protein